jgi:hypothetical protein
MPIEALDAALAGLAAAEDPNHDLALDQAAMDLQVILFQKQAGTPLGKFQYASSNTE